MMNKPKAAAPAPSPIKATPASSDVGAVPTVEQPKQVRALTVEDAKFLLEALQEIEARGRLTGGPNMTAIAMMAKRAIDRVS